MTEEQTTEQPQGTEQRTYTQDQWESKQNNFVSQITELKGQLSQLTEAQQQTQAEREAQEAERMAKREEWKALSEQQADKLLKVEAIHQETVGSLQAEINTMKQDSAIAKAGVTDELAILGLKMKYSLLGEEAPPMEDWLESLKGDKPELFTAPQQGAGTRNAAAGVAKTSGSMSDEFADELIKSSDPAKRMQGHDHFKTKYGLNNKVY